MSRLYYAKKLFGDGMARAVYSQSVGVTHSSGTANQTVMRYGTVTRETWTDAETSQRYVEVALDGSVDEDGNPSPVTLPCDAQFFVDDKVKVIQVGTNAVVLPVTDNIILVAGKTATDYIQETDEGLVIGYTKTGEKLLLAPQAMRFFLDDQIIGNIAPGNICLGSPLEGFLMLTDNMLRVYDTSIGSYDNYEDWQRYEQPIASIGEGTLVVGGKSFVGGTYIGFSVITEQDTAARVRAPYGLQFEDDAYFDGNMTVRGKSCYLPENTKVGDEDVAVSRQLHSGSGSTSVTLSSSAANFAFVKVFVQSGGGNVTSVDIPNGKTGVATLYDNATTSWLAFVRITVSGTSVRIASELNLPVSGYSVGTGNVSVDARIIKVIGFV